MATNLPATIANKVSEATAKDGASFNAMMARWAQDGSVNLLTPVVGVSELPLCHSIMLVAAMCDGPEDSYHSDFFHGNKPADQDVVSLSAHAIQKIAGVVGATVVSKRLDDGSDPCFCQFIAEAVMVTLAGETRSITATGTMDLREGSPLSKSQGKKPKQLAMSRQFIVPHAEARAQRNAFRKLIGLKGKYSKKDELSKPFLAPKLKFDMRAALDDPRLKDVALEEMRLQIRRQLPAPPQPSLATRQIETAPPPDVDTAALLAEAEDNTSPVIDVPPVQTASSDEPFFTSAEEPLDPLDNGVCPEPEEFEARWSQAKTQNDHESMVSLILQLFDEMGAGMKYHHLMKDVAASKQREIDEGGPPVFSVVVANIVADHADEPNWFDGVFRRAINKVF